MSTKFTDDEWLLIFQQRTQSGLSVRKWCDSNQISYDKYKYWEKKLLRRTDPERIVSPMDFVELPQALGAGIDNRTTEPSDQTAADPDREPDTGAPSCREEAVRPFHGSHTGRGTDEPVRPGRTAAFPQTGPERDRHYRA